MSVDWVRHGILWHVYPLGLLGAEPDRLPRGEPARHRLAALDPWLDHLVELGASGLLIGPLFESSTHGYDTVDHLAIDRRLGDEADFAALVEAAHRRGVRVVLDGVFNHVGRDFPRFGQALAGGPDDAASRWFHLYWPQGWRPGDPEPGYEHFEGHRHLVTLNHSAPEVVDHVVDVMCHWLAAGADGWRLDAAYAVPPRFWAAVLPRVRQRHPDAFVFAEMIHGDYAGVVRTGGVDSVTQYELWKAIWSSLNDGNFHELAWTLRRHDELLDTFVPVTFVGNHDVTRIASKLADPARLAHALVVLFTVAGTPCVYAGDEVGLLGVKEDRAGGDDAVRPAFPAGPAELGQLPHVELPPSADGAPGRSVLSLHQQLIGVRRRNAWLHDARTTAEHVTNEQIVLRTVGARGDESIVAALNVAATSAKLPAKGCRQVIAGTAEVGADTVTVPAGGWAVLDA